MVLGGVDGTKDRKRWVVWHEGGRYPDVIIEITSPSTKSKDTKGNLLLYSKVFRMREYFWYDEAVGGYPTGVLLFKGLEGGDVKNGRRQGSPCEQGEPRLR